MLLRELQKLEHVGSLHAKTLEQMQRQYAGELDALKALHEQQLDAYRVRENESQLLKSLSERVEVSALLSERVKVNALFLFSLP